MFAKYQSNPLLSADRCRPTPAGYGRRGLTLLEVLVSTVILAGTLMALSQLSSNGVRAALRTELDSAAAVRCQSKLDELLATRDFSQVGRDVPFEDDPSWYWLAKVDSGPTHSLAQLTVVVQRDWPANAKARFQLVRLVPRRETIADRTGDKVAP